MANILGKIAKTGKEKFTQRDSKLNFVVNKNVVSYYGIDGKKDDRNLDITTDNFRFQIGKMDKKDETLYTKEFLAGSLEYLLHKVKSGNKLTIQIRRDLADLLKNNGDKKIMHDILSYDQEKKEIDKLIKKYFKEHANKVNIINVSNQYPELFTLLENEGIEGLKSEKEIILDPKNFTALDIAKYLYGIAKSDIKFMLSLYATKPEEQKLSDDAPIGENISDYYALIEIAIRLYEILTGKYIQGGAIRQTKYDKIIGMLLYGKDSKDKDLVLVRFPGLIKLHGFCKQVNPDVQFDRVYLDNTQIQKVEEKKVERKKSISKMKFYTGLATAALVSILAYHTVTKEIQKHKTKENLENILHDKVKNMSIWSRFENHSTSLEGEVAEKDLQRYSERMADQFIAYYGYGNLTKEDIQILILDAINQDNVNDLYDGNTPYSGYMFLIHNMIPENKLTLIKNGISFVPYKELDIYAKEFENTFLYTSENTKIMEKDGGWPKIKNVEAIGKYITRGGSVYNIGIAKIGEFVNEQLVNKTYLVAGAQIEGITSNGTTETKEITNMPYDIESGKHIAEDLLWQRYPEATVLRDIFNMYYGTTFDDRYLLNIKDSLHEENKHKFECQLLHYFHKNNIHIDSESEHFYKTIMNVMSDGFVIENRKELESLGIDMTPYNGYLEYKTAFENSLSMDNNDFIKKHDIYMMTYKDLLKYDSKFLGDYITKDGDMYILVQVILEGKPYIAAAEKKLHNNTGDNEYGFFYGEIVAKDIFSLRKK